MKKILFVFIFLVLITLLLIDHEVTLERREKSNPEMKALFVSYLELNTHIRGKTKSKVISNIKKIVDNTHKNHFNMIILQVRSHDDAIYKSEIFNTSKSIILKDNTSFDVLKYFLEYAREENVEVYLWINPFRITSSGEELTSDMFAYKYRDSDTIKKIGDIYYYNPSSSVTTNHIVDGIKELVSNYKFKGLLFDDYFYPSNDIDTKEYEDYLKTSKYITKNEYNLYIINKLIRKVYKSIKSINKKVLFGISPDGNIDNNYSKNFADVKLWCSKKGYIDFIMPQLYYGFKNETKPFISIMNTWDDLIKNKNISLYYALSFYKVGRSDTYAKSGSNEWIENNDIIKKQILVTRNTHNYKGFALFRYDYLFNKDNYSDTTLDEFNNLKSILE